jgi:hypothetical protein
LAAVLRASGRDFDVDSFVDGCHWRIAAVFHRGDARARRPHAGADGRRCEESGLNVVVSEAGFHEFATQVSDAVAFLSDQDAAVRRLVAFPSVTDVVLDFGVAWRDVVAQSDRFPADLVRLAGACGIALELSHYPVSGGDAATG